MAKRNPGPIGASSSDPARARARTVLVVDDLDINRNLLRKVFETGGFEMLEAGDGLQALEILHSRGVDAVISDILMPNMDGYNLCRALRADPRLRDIPFIIYTSTYLSPGEEDVAKQCGADLYLAKPLSPAEIMKTVRRLTASARPTSPPPSTPSENEVLKQYSEMLVRKLEGKSLELYERNKKLEASEEIFRQLVENIEQVFFLYQADGSLIYASPSYEKIFSRSLESLRADPLSWLDAVAVEDRQAMRKICARAPEAPIEREYRLERPDGAVRWIRSRIFPIRSGSGAVERYCRIADDITALKSAESQLRQVQKMDSIGRLAGGVAHDFNNVLTAINGYAQFLLMKESPDASWREDVQEILAAAGRAAALTSQLLSFSRKQVLQPKALNLNASITGLNKMLRRLIGEDIRIEMALAPKIGLCKADPGQLEQVVVNLAVNARDAMPDGGTLTFTTSDVEIGEAEAGRPPDASPGPHVRLTLRDTGCGMNPETLSHVFEPFFTTKPTGKGTGLGLATVYGIVRQSGGHVEVSSVHGRGTSFHIFLPRLPDDAKIEVPSAAPQPAASRRTPATILLVEDDEFVRPITRRILANLGYAVLEARDGLQALSVAAKNADVITLALVDMVMPGASGPEVIACLRERLPNLKIVCMSGYTDHAVLERTLSKQALFVQKPFTEQQLAAKIAEALGKNP